MSKDSDKIKKLLKDRGSEAYLKAKANNIAYILEDGWIVRVYADDHREKIKYIGETNIKE